MRQVSVGPTEVLQVSGEIDLATIPIFHSALVRFSNEHVGSTLVVDLDGVSACDDSALGVLLGAAGRLREANGDLVVVCTDPILRSRLTRTGFDRAVRVESSLSSVTKVAAAAAAADQPDSPTGSR